MFESMCKITRRNTHAADHSLNDVAVMAKQTSWGSAVVTVIGSNLLSIKGASADGAFSTLKFEHGCAHFCVHAGSALALAFCSGPLFFLGIHLAEGGALGGVFGSSDGVLALLDFGAIAIGFVLVFSSLISLSTSRSLAFNVRFAPGLLVGSVSGPLFISAVAFFHRITPIHCWGMMRHGVRFTNAQT